MQRDRKQQVKIIQNNNTSTPLKHFSPTIFSLILGTVQLGMPYGIANVQGQPDQTTSNAIVKAALDNGIHFFDTAQAYGSSELVLGRALQGQKNEAYIITKLAPQLPENRVALLESIKESLSRLRTQTLYCLMLHREEQLSLLDDWYGDVLKSILTHGVAQHLGVSVYTPEMAFKALAHPLISIVQIPASLFDRRFDDAGVFTAAEAASKELHIRSVYLQGLLCLAPEQIPQTLAQLHSAQQRLQNLAVECECTTAQLALSWMLKRYPSSRCILGAESVEQVLKNIDYAHLASTIHNEIYAKLDSIFPPQLPELLNPALWPR